MKEFSNKTVIVTGAGSGMGRAYAFAFAKLGAKLALNDYDKAALNETVDALHSDFSGIELYVKAFDVADESEMADFAANSKEKLGNAYVVINNAGIEGAAKPLYEMSLDDIKRVMDVNFYGVVNGTKAFLPQLVEENAGALVNVSSIFGLIGTPSHVDYCASKFAVRGFTEALAVEFTKSPIQIHCLHPGGIDTNIARSDAAQEFVKKYLTTPPEEIVDHVIHCIRKNKMKIVYGNDAYKTWLGANFVPQKWLTNIIWSDMKNILDLSAYKRFIK